MAGQWRQKFIDFFELSDDRQESKEVHRASPNAKSNTDNVGSGQDVKLKRPTTEVVSMENRMQKETSAKIAIVVPRFGSEGRDLVDTLLSGQAVVINLRRMDQMDSEKLIDFMNGAVYAMRGSLQKISETIYLAAPQNVQIDATDLSDNDGRIYE